MKDGDFYLCSRFSPLLVLMKKSCHVEEAQVTKYGQANKGLNPGNTHVSLETDPSPAEPLYETPAMTDFSVNVSVRGSEPEDPDQLGLGSQPTGTVR